MKLVYLWYPLDGFERILTQRNEIHGLFVGLHFEKAIAIIKCLQSLLTTYGVMDCPSWSNALAFFLTNADGATGSLLFWLLCFCACVVNS